jgi:hypothetical protein
VNAFDPGQTIGLYITDMLANLQEVLDQALAIMQPWPHSSDHTQRNRTTDPRLTEE